jgi:hypothetical protein
MIIKYVDQTDQMKELTDIDIEVEYHEDLKLNKKLIKNSWRIFIQDINQLKLSAYKNGVDDYYKDTMKYSLMSNNTRKIDPAWDLYSEEGKNLSYVKYPRTCYLKLAYLYRDLKKDGKFIFPTFMKSIYTKNGDIKIEQISAFGKILIQSQYFPKLRMDFFISKRNAQKTGNTDTIKNFFDIFVSKANRDCSKAEFIVTLDKYTDINSEYYVYNIFEDTNNYNFYDDILQTEDLWKFMYYEIINAKLNSLQDYRILLDKIVLEGQKFI